MSLNDEASKLEVLPPLTPDIIDKLIILKVAKHPMPMPTESAGEQKAFWDALVKELPAFVDFLLKFEIPTELRSPRYGITHFQHPDVVAALEEIEPHSQLLNLINVTLGKNFAGPWHGTAAELAAKLTARTSPVAREAKMLLRHPSACGSLLGVLSRHHPERVQKGAILHGIRKWVITPTPVAEAAR
jgi:hypothetical protein